MTERDYVLSVSPETRDYIFNENNYCVLDKKRVQTKIHSENESTKKEKPLLLAYYTLAGAVPLVAIEGGVCLSTNKTELFECTPPLLFYITNVVSPHILVNDSSTYTSERFLLSGGLVHGEPSDQSLFVCTNNKTITYLPPLPLSLFGHAIIKLPIYDCYDTINKKESCYLLLGGLNQHNQVNNKVYGKEDITGEWKEYPPLHCGQRAFFAACYNNYHSYIHGGLVDEGSVSNDLWHHNGNEWEHLENDGPFLYKHHSCLIAAELGKFIVFGGFTKEHKLNETIFGFDILSQTWTQLGKIDIKSTILASIHNSRTIYVLESIGETWKVLKTKVRFSYMSVIPYDQMFEFEPDEIELIQEEQAIFSVVHEGDYYGRHVVLKSFNNAPGQWSEYLDDFTRELSGSNLTQKAPGISVAIGFCRKPLMLMFDYKQPLRKYIIANNPLPFAEVIRFAWQIALHVNEFALDKLIHGDLKLDNCLIDGNKDLWLCDLGLVQSCFNKKERFYSFHGAPELWTKYKSGFDLRKTEIYAFGFTLWQLLTNDAAEYPFTKSTVKNDTQNGIRPIIPECHPQLKELIQLCWQHDPESRPTINSVIQSLEKIGNEVGLFLKQKSNKPPLEIDDLTASAASFKCEALENVLRERNAAFRNMEIAKEVLKEAESDLKKADENLWKQQSLQFNSTEQQINEPIPLQIARMDQSDAFEKVEKQKHIVKVAQLALTNKTIEAEKSVCAAAEFLKRFGRRASWRTATISHLTDLVGTHQFRSPSPDLPTSHKYETKLKFKAVQDLLKDQTNALYILKLAEDYLKKSKKLLKESEETLLHVEAKSRTEANELSMARIHYLDALVQEEEDRKALEEAQLDLTRKVEETERAISEAKAHIEQSESSQEEKKQLEITLSHLINAFQRAPK